jgi:hypothetical protein
VPWLRRLVAGLSPRRSGFDPGSVHVGLVMDKVAMGQVFPEYFGFPLSFSFHRCSITRRNEKTNNIFHLHHRVAQALRLRCVRSICFWGGGGGGPSPQKETADVRSDVLTAVNIKITALWDMTPCTLADKLQPTQCHIPEKVTLILRHFSLNR